VTNERHEKDRVIAAAHEAAHAVAAAVFGFRILGSGIWYEGGAVRPWEGQTGYDTGRAETEKAPDVAEDELVVGWAGRAIERVRFGGRSLSPGLDPDVTGMVEIARRMLPGVGDARLLAYVMTFEPVALNRVSALADQIDACANALLNAPAAEHEWRIDHELDSAVLVAVLSDALGYPVSGPDPARLGEQRTDRSDARRCAGSSGSDQAPRRGLRIRRSGGSNPVRWHRW
jgi:hypothetical protein